MRVVHKYVLDDVRNIVRTHKGAKFLHVDNQREHITIWAEVDPDRAYASRVVYVVGTGHPIPGPAREYVGSAVMANGDFVFHIYLGEESDV